MRLGEVSIGPAQNYTGDRLGMGGIQDGSTLTGSRLPDLTADDYWRAYAAADARRPQGPSPEQVVRLQNVLAANRAMAAAINDAAIIATETYAIGVATGGGGLLVNSVMKSPVGREVVKGLIDIAVDFVIPQMPDYDARRFRQDLTGRPQIEAPADPRPTAAGGAAPGGRPRLRR